MCANITFYPEGEANRQNGACISVNPSLHVECISKVEVRAVSTNGESAPAAYVQFYWQNLHVFPSTPEPIDHPCIVGENSETASEQVPDPATNQPTVFDWYWQPSPSYGGQSGNLWALLVNEGTVGDCPQVPPPGSAPSGNPTDCQQPYYAVKFEVILP